MRITSESSDIIAGEENKIIDANDKNARQILDKVKYTLDVFRREYMWERKQIEQVIEDLTTKFSTDYKETNKREAVANYGKYYLGSIVTVSKNGKKLIIDGQQRLTSLTLLLIYLHMLHNRTLSYSSIRYTMFSLVKYIRDKDVNELVKILKEKIKGFLCSYGCS